MHAKILSENNMKRSIYRLISGNKLAFSWKEQHHIKHSKGKYPKDTIQTGGFLNMQWKC